MKQNVAQSSQSTAVIILGHGSPVTKANDTLHEIVNSIKERGIYDIVQPAFLQFVHPDFSEAVDIIVKQGIVRMVVHPYFLYMGAHVTKDLPIEIENIKKKYPNLEIIYSRNLGFHNKLVDIAMERIEEAIGRNIKTNIQASKNIGQNKIEAESFRIIGEHLDESKFSPLEIPIVKRIIHTTADFEYADLVRFGNKAIESGINVILKGANVITDVRMAEVGINKERLNKFGGKTLCFISDEDVKENAEKEKTTRSSAAMRKALEFIDGNIVAIGNAPTALRELIRLINNGTAKPALVIGAPVGFVDAEESKEELMKLDIPYIAIKGKKGGSTVAAAIVNALLMMAEEMLVKPTG